MQLKQKRVTGSPLSLQLILTKQCNLNCSYCSAHQFNQKETEPELSTGEWLRLLKRLKELQAFQVGFTGGEMFLREDIFDILEAAAALKFPKLMITTNGTLMDDKRAKELKTLGITNVAVSLDGDETYHDSLRGDGSFEKTLKGVTHLVNNGIVPEILFTPLKSNFRRISHLVALLHPLGIKKLSFNNLHPTGRCSENYDDIMLDCLGDVDEFNDMLDHIRETYNGLKVESPPFTYHCYPRISKEEKEALSKKGKQYLKPCSAGHSSCNITASGWVIPCSELVDFKGGNIRNQDLLDIWRHSEKLGTIRNLSNIASDEIPYCRNCQYNVFCNGGCRADAYAVFEDLTAPDPFCPYWKENDC